MATRTMAKPLPVSAAVAALGLLAVGIAPVSGQAEDTATDPGEARVIEVTAVEYAFAGVPDGIAAGSALVLRNDGAELHELVVARIADDVDETAEALLAIGEAAITSGMVELVSVPEQAVEPGAVSDTPVELDRPGRYVILCSVPQGANPTFFAALGVTEDMPMAQWPPEALAILENSPHYAAGMMQEFVVGPADVLGPEPLAGHPPA